MPENMPKPSMLLAPNHFQYAPSFIGTHQHLSHNKCVILTHYRSGFLSISSYIQWRREGVCRPGQKSVLSPPPVRSVLQSWHFSGFCTWCEPTFGGPASSLPSPPLHSYPLISHRFLFPPLEVGPLNSAIEGLGIFRRGVTFSANFRQKGAFPTDHCWCQNSRVIALSCGIKTCAVHCLLLSQSKRVSDRRTG